MLARQTFSQNKVLAASVRAPLVAACSLVLSRARPRGADNEPNGQELNWRRVRPRSAFLVRPGFFPLRGARARPAIMINNRMSAACGQDPFVSDLVLFVAARRAFPYFNGRSALQSLNDHVFRRA